MFKTFVSLLSGHASYINSFRVLPSKGNELSRKTYFTVLLHTRVFGLLAVHV